MSPKHKATALLSSQRGACPEFPKTVDWDTPFPQSHSFMDPTASHHATRNILSFYDIKDRYEQIPCTMKDDFCFDLSKCSTTGPLTVYAHGNGTTLANQYVTNAAHRHPKTIQQVFSPSNACLLVLTCDSFRSFEQLVSSPTWKDGQNHFVWYNTHCFRAHYSRTFDKHNYAKAAIASSTLTDASIRLGYAMPRTQVRGSLTKEFAAPKHMPQYIPMSIGMPRRWLLGYKGRIAAQYPHPWFQHRWLAYEFWNDEEKDVVIDTKCWGKFAGYKGKKEYDNVVDYSEMLWNSTFAFCPGDANAGSYRFSEALGLGAIPVVTPKFVPPFEPDIDWSTCVVRVSEARIVDLPRLLRNMPSHEIQRRQRRRLELFQKTMGWVQDGDQWRLDSGMNAFAVSLKIWAMRVKKSISFTTNERRVGAFHMTFFPNNSSAHFSFMVSYF